MKKTYTKPVIIIEDFSLNTTIAGSCEHVTNTAGYDQCGLDFGGDMIFLTGVAGCTFKVEDDDGLYNEICYHTPYDTNNVFNS